MIVQALTLWLLVPKLAIGGEPADIAVNGDAIEFRIRGEVACRYQVAKSQIKPYFWPLLAPNGAVVTRGWPMEKAAAGGSIDHVHQKSGWFTFGDVIPVGVGVAPKRSRVEGVDFWSEIPVHGRIVCVEVGTPSGGRIATRNEWRMPDGTTILSETRTLALHELGAGRLLVVDCEIRAPLCPIEFGDTKEGAFGVRVNDQLRTELGENRAAPPGNLITNSRGQKGEKECWGRLADWCDYSGTIDGKAAGIAVFDDATNAHRACWHVRGYGLMAANPFGRAKSGFPDQAGKTDRAKLAKGERLKLRYGIYAHDGDVTSGKVAEAYAKFVELAKMK